MIPYGRQLIDEDDIREVVRVLRSDWLTTGPEVELFETSVAERVGAKRAVAVSSGTAALHAAMAALGVGLGDEVIVPAMTFAATANCVVIQGATPVFADIDAETLLIDPLDVERKITERTRAVIAVDFAGQPCDYDALRRITMAHGLVLVADACHALGSTYKGMRAGTLADVSVFSFHPVKHITTGEGGMMLTDDDRLADRARRFRSHGIDLDHRSREQRGTWFYEMVDLGFNYRMTDLQCALGRSQLAKLDGWILRRRAIAGTYDRAFAGSTRIRPLAVAPDREHAYHLYVVRIDFDHISGGRQALMGLLREGGVATNVHYIPVHLHPYYRRSHGTQPGQCPVAEASYHRILTIPDYPGMSDRDVLTVISCLNEAVDQLWCSDKKRACV